MPAPIFPLADRNELEAAAAAIGEQAARIDLLIDGIVAQRPCPKPRYLSAAYVDRCTGCGWSDDLCKCF